MTQAPLMVGVSGTRGIVGQSLTPMVVAEYAAAFGAWLNEQAAGQTPHLVVGRDSRPSGPMCEHAAVAGLLASGCRVTRLGIAATPAVALMARQHHAHGALVLTASHNPAPWNGLKPMDHRGSALEPQQIRQVIDRFHEKRFDFKEAEQLLIDETDDSAARRHAEQVLALVDQQAIRNAGLRVVVDSVHGAGGEEVAILLERLGVERIHLWEEPTGRFPHAPEPTAENVTELGKQVRARHAHAGFAQDPDADRLAIVDEQGRYIGEEYTLALGALHRLAEGQTAVVNLSTSRMIDDLAKRAGATIVRTPVGEANVAQAMRAHSAALGGEGNGGLILPELSYIRDSLAGIALVLEMLAQTNQPLSALVDQIPHYALAKQKLPADAKLVERLPELLSHAFPEAECDTQDGVRLAWADRWVHVRASNTEPIIRLFAEAPDQQAAEALLDRVRQTLT